MHNKSLIKGVSALVLAGALAVPAALPGPMALGGSSTRVETAASAIPTLANPSVKDKAWGAARITSSPGKAVASSVATSNCAGCTAQSTSLQAVYFDGGTGAAADNTATAWSTCANCSSSAVSIQLVVARRAQPVKANNRALALSATCAGCTTTAAAIQFVMAGNTTKELSDQARILIAGIQAQLADGLAQPAANKTQQKAQSQSLADESAKKMEKVIATELGATAVQRKVDVQVG